MRLTRVTSDLAELKASAEEVLGQKLLCLVFTNVMVKFTLKLFLMPKLLLYRRLYAVMLI